MKPVIEIQVHGQTNSGKSTVIRLIQEALTAAGLQAEVKDPDHHFTQQRSPALQQHALAAVAAKCDIHLIACNRPLYDFTQAREEADKAYKEMVELAKQSNINWPARAPTGIPLGRLDILAGPLVPKKNVVFLNLKACDCGGAKVGTTHSSWCSVKS